MVPPAEYPPHRPKHGRDEVVPPSLSTLELQLREVQQAIEERVTEDTGVQRVNTRVLASQVEAAVAAHQAVASAAVRRTVARWAALIGVIASAIATIAVAVVRELPDSEAQDVRGTIEQQGEQLESRVEQQHDRLQAVEKKVDRLETIAVEQQVQIVDGIEYLGAKIDAVSARAERVEEPTTLEQARVKLGKERSRRKLFEDNATPTSPLPGD